jgi:tRNA A37 N6-isopentenylltransferase MiaA
MPLGPGKYDDLCTDVREKSAAEGAIVIVVGGNRGTGFSCQATLGVLASLPQLLETVAREMRQSTSRDAATSGEVDR